MQVNVHRGTRDRQPSDRAVVEVGDLVHACACACACACARAYACAAAEAGDRVHAVAGETHVHVLRVHVRVFRA